MYELYWIQLLKLIQKKTNKIITTNEVQNKCDSYDIKEDISKFKW